MKIYIDLVFLLNFFFDFSLLFLVSYILKRHIKIYRIFLGSIVGSISIFFLFLPLSTISLFLLKIITSILITITTFGYKNEKYFKKNFLYLYIISIILGGVLYFLNMTFSYNNNELSINFIILIISSPIITYLYLKEQRNYKNIYTLIHKIEFNLDGINHIYNAYLDTGNKLSDPYLKRPIILIYDKHISFKYEESILVPYKTLEHEGVIKCKKVKEFKIDDKYIKKDILIGLSKDSFNIEGIECIMPNKLKEEF